MTGTSFYNYEAPTPVDRDSAKVRVGSIVEKLLALKTTLGEIEADYEKIERKGWLDERTLKRLDKAITVMKVGYKIGKRGINRDKKFGDPASHDEPELTEADTQSLTDAAADFTVTDIGASTGGTK